MNFEYSYKNNKKGIKKPDFMLYQNQPSSILRSTKKFGEHPDNNNTTPYKTKTKTPPLSKLLEKHRANNDAYEGTRGLKYKSTLESQAYTSNNPYSRQKLNNFQKSRFEKKDDHLNLNNQNERNLQFRTLTDRYQEDNPATNTRKPKVDTSNILKRIDMFKEKKSRPALNLESARGEKRNDKQDRPGIDLKKFAITDFEIGIKLGKGRFGDVFLAREKKHDFIVALKILKKAEIQRLNAEKLIVREIKIHSFLDHENIIKLYGFFHDDDNIYLILEYAPDGELYKELKSTVS